MNIESIHRGRSTKTVVISRLGNATEVEIVDMALAAANENRSSLLGWSCGVTEGFSSDEDFATVHLWTD